MRMAADREESMKTDQQYLFEQVKSKTAADQSLLGDEQSARVM